MEITLLADHREAIPQLAQWFYAEWSYLHPQHSIADVENALRERGNTDKIPLALVAFDGDVLLGAVSLKTHDMDVRTDLSPWLASLYVNALMRGQGIGTQLVGALEETARGLGIPRIFLFTPTAEGFYAKLGWEMLECIEYHGRQVSIMKKDLGCL